MTQFQDFHISDALKKRIASLNFVTPTPVQAGAIPPALEGKDVLATAQTGTGKTLSFLIPILEKFAKTESRGASALILLPTRELAMQVETAYRSLNPSQGHSVALVVGGMAEGPQLQLIRRGARLIVATPGRLEDYLNRKLVKLDQIQILVLDEVDRMLDMGFEPAIRRIANCLPQSRQTLCYSATLDGHTRPAGADTVESAKAKAAAIQAQLTAAQAEMSTLSQQYDAAAYKLSQVNASIATTKASINADRQKVEGDRTTLSKAAVANYVTDGSNASGNPLFSGNQKTAGAIAEYNNIASGDINEAVANLHTAENALNVQEAQLTTQQSQAQGAVNAENDAIAQNKAAIASQSAALSQENGQVAVLVAQQQQQEAAAAAQVTQAKLAAATTAAAATTTASAQSSSSSVARVAAIVAPPTSSGGAGAVQAAESQIGVPYAWGAESPGVAFDCSGLTAWAWGQVGVGLPHYSGAQMGASAPVPVSDLQPGDLLFYGPGGSEHVAMYVGGGSMIEAPYTGASVWITGLRLGDGFVGAGRP